MFNFSGSEIIFLLVLGLVVLGPEKLPGVLRKAGRLYGEFKRVTSDAQSELRQALGDPIREIQGTANEYKGIFTDAAKSVNKEITDTIGEPKFIPHPASTEQDKSHAPSNETNSSELKSDPNVTPSNETPAEPLMLDDLTEPEKEA
jgi:sec-independent protein translocase protein TatB